MTRLFIEDYEMDIDKELVNRITYAIDDLEHLDSKSTSFTKTIVLPGTTKNNNLLGNIFDFNNSNFTFDSLNNVKYNFNASRLARCRIDVNGLQVIKGSFRLLEIVYNGSQVEYECAVFGELGGFISKVGNNRLEDLDFSNYDHSYTNTAITDSWDNANSGQGIYYPLIDIGEVSNGAPYGVAKKDYQYRTFRPALHVREYLDKIITNAGYTWESQFFNTDFFKRLIVPHNSKQLTRISSTGLDISYSGTGQLFQTPDGYYEIEHPTQTVLGAFTTLDNKTFTYGGTNTISGRFKLRVQGTYDYSQNLDANLRLTLFTSAVVSTNVYFFPPATSGTIPFDITLDVDATFNTNDFVRATLVAANDFGDSWYVNVTDSSIVYTLSSLTPVPINLGEDIYMNDTIPRGIFQKDFFASILKMFYLLVSEDKYKERHLVIEPFIDFYATDIATYEDWSLKVDRSKQIRLKPMSELNSRYYELKFKKDTDYYNETYQKRYEEGYGDRIFDNGFEFAKEKETVEIIFSNSVLVGYLNEDKVVPAIFKLRNQVEEKIDHNIRIMQAKKVTGVTSWNILNAATVVSSNTDYGYAGHLDDPDAPDADICFGVPKELFFVLVSGNLSNNLFNAYYSSYMAEITDKDSRLLQCMLKLSDIDIYNLDFSTFKFIDGGLYRLQKLIDYASGENEPTKAELLRVIYTTY
jgi:hypothetical protein